MPMVRTNGKVSGNETESHNKVTVGDGEGGVWWKEMRVSSRCCFECPRNGTFSPCSEDRY